MTGNKGCPSPYKKGIRMDHLQDQDSEGEDDPTKLLDHWLGELNTLGKVSLTAADGSHAHCTT